MDRLVALAARQFDETAPAAAVPAARPARGPLAASPGIATGPVRHLRYADDTPEVGPVGDPAEEKQRSEAAVTAARGEVERVKSVATGQVGAEQAAIFDAHLALLRGHRRAGRRGGSDRIRCLGGDRLAGSRSEP